VIEEPQLFGAFQVKMTPSLVFNEVFGATGVAGFIELTVTGKLI
jgi:hypothetical protein